MRLWVLQESQNRKHVKRLAHPLALAILRGRTNYQSQGKAGSQNLVTPRDEVDFRLHMNKWLFRVPEWQEGLNSVWCPSFTLPLISSPHPLSGTQRSMSRYLSLLQKNTAQLASHRKHGER